MNTKEKYASSFKDGKRAELELANIAVSSNLKVIWADKKTDMFKHWDLTIQGPNVKRTIDVKALKKLDRADDQTEEGWVLIELTGVKNMKDGRLTENKGWLEGEADWIAFETMTSFIMVDRLKLKQLVYSLVSLDDIAYSSKNAKYKVYGRPGRYDLFTWIEIDKVSSIMETEWTKIPMNSVTQS